jgi:DNA-binding NarL/FixJ family response regulator
MPEMNGYETLKWLQENRPEIKVIVVSMFDSDFSIMRSMRLGARAFLRKTMSPEELKNAIYTVDERGFYYSNCITKKLFSALAYSADTNNDFKDCMLTEKEIACFSKWM